MQLAARSAVHAALTAAALALVPVMAAARTPIQTIVDGVRIDVTRAVADGAVLPPQAGDATQEATVVDSSGQRLVSVIAVPYGFRPATEDALPLARRGGAQAYRNALHDFRVRTGEFAMPAPVIDMFGAGISGEVSVRHQELAGAGAFGRDVLTAEWVSEAGSRIWIVRAVEYAPTGHSFDSAAGFVAGLGRLGVWSDGGSLSRPTTVRKDVVGGPEPLASASPSARDAAADDRKPPAYGDRCDVGKYDAATQFYNWRNYLGASFRGVPACGPRPAAGGVLVDAAFDGQGAGGVAQFGSTELSLRWMYLVYGTPPFAGAGDELCGAYDAAAGGQRLTAVANSGNAAALPHAGDVICYNTGGTGGHSALAVATHVDGAGRGWIEVMEQDGAANGFARLLVLGGRVMSNLGGDVTGWLSAPRQR